MFQKKFTFAISMCALCLIGINYVTPAQAEDPYTLIENYDAPGIAAVSLVNKLVDLAGEAANEAAASAQEAKDTLENKINLTGHTASKALITNTSGKITTGTITGSMITDKTITNADISTTAGIEATKISGLTTVATSGSYSDLSNKPAINNATLTIQNGATNNAIGTFTANASSDTTATIPAATPSTAGLAKIGVIPSGSATSTTYATIWVQ
ncbi:MAG: hypothetical protein R8N50_03975 [Alphaproteobacteria bacterium]|nr:hypothetical protein [Alphaproteobacteria bacterium]